MCVCLCVSVWVCCGLQHKQDEQKNWLLQHQTFIFDGECVLYWLQVGWHTLSHTRTHAHTDMHMQKHSKQLQKREGTSVFNIKRGEFWEKQQFEPENKRQLLSRSPTHKPRASAARGRNRLNSAAVWIKADGPIIGRKKDTHKPPPYPGQQNTGYSLHSASHTITLYAPDLHEDTASDARGSCHVS